MQNCGFQLQYSYLKLPSLFHSENEPSKATRPKLTLLNESLADDLGLDFSNSTTQELAELLTGNSFPSEAKPFSQAYSGHQFGHFTNLGDGRAHLLGEHISPKGARYDLQWKGSGRTPYSRRGDGRACLGPMLREFIISEALFHLGIPTSRSLAVTETGEPVYREKTEPGAILMRVASSHLRIGTFEFAARSGSPNTIEKLLNYTIERHYPELAEHENPALSLLNEVMNRQISLIAHWMRVGFIHGVMNTDNMTIS